MLTDSKMKSSVTHMFQKLPQAAFGNLHNCVIRGWQEHTQCWANDHIVCWRVVILFIFFRKSCKSHIETAEERLDVGEQMHKLGIRLQFGNRNVSPGTRN